MTKKSDTPAIRFKGFTDTWEQRKAIDIADYSKGNGYSKGDLTDAGTPIILYGRLYTKYQFAISEVDTFAVSRNGAVYSQGNEVIVPASGETADDIARASAVEKSGVLLGGDLNILRPFDFINPLFLALAISNGEPQKELAKKAQGKSVVHIHNTDIQEVTIAYPSRTEQDRIVSVFRQLDNLITLHQRKYDKLTNVKKSMLEKMFPKNGSNVPEIRFKGFTEAWEQRKLGNVANYRRGSFPQPYGKSEWYDGDGAMPFVQVADVSDEMNLVENTKQKISMLAQPMSVFAGKNTVLVTLQGSIGRVAITQYGAFVDRTVLIFEKYKEKIDTTFWAYIVKQKFIDEARKAPGGTIKTITKEALSDFDLSIPNYKEQQQIGTFFKQLDNLITLHQRELEKLKNIKKSCLENMFV